MVMAVSGLEWSERLTEVTESRAGVLRAREPWTGTGHTEEEESTPHTLQNAQCGGLIKYQVRLVNM